MQRRRGGGVQVNGKTVTVMRGSWLGLIHNSDTVYAHICCFLGSKKDFCHPSMVIS